MELSHQKHRKGCWGKGCIFIFVEEEMGPQGDLATLVFLALATSSLERATALVSGFKEEGSV
jgi:hypothetical protein